MVRAYVDGNNLLHALGRGAPTRTVAHDMPAAPAAAIIGRLRAAFPPSVIVDLVFDGPRAGGIDGRLATGLRVSYGGRGSADALIVAGVQAQLDADGPAGTWGVLVITDDRDLRHLVSARGARTAGTAWLVGRLDRVAGTATQPAGSGRPGSGPARQGAGAPGREGARAGPSGHVRGHNAAPLPRAGTTIGHRRPPRPPRDADEE